MPHGGGELGAVLFTDIVDSTSIAAEMGNLRWSELVSRHHGIIRHLLSRFGGREIDTAGDGFFATFDRPAAAIRCAAASVEAVRKLGIEIRSGMSFGELETTDGKPSGLVVNTAARIMSAAGAGEVLVPASVREIVEGTSIGFQDRGSRRLKGLERQVRIFRVTEVDGAKLSPPLEAEESARRRGQIFPGGGSRRTALAVGIVLGAIGVIVGIALLASSSGETGPNATKGSPPSLANMVVRMDPESGALTTRIPINGNPQGLSTIQHSLAAGEGGVWLLRPPVLLHLDPLHSDVRPSEIRVGREAYSFDLRAGLDAVWILGGRPTRRDAGAVWTLNPATDELQTFFATRDIARVPSALALGHAVWVGLRDGTLVRIDARTMALDEVHTPYSIDRIAITADHVWLVDVLAGKLVPVEEGSMRLGRAIDITGSLDFVEGHGDSLWVLEIADGIVERLDGATGEVTGTARIGTDASDLNVAGEWTWAGGDGFLDRVDPLTLEVTDFPIDADVLGVAADPEGFVWVYLGRRGDD